MSRNILPRVAFVSHSPWFAGAERALVNLLEHLPEHEIQPIVLFPTTNGPIKKIVKKELGLPVFELPYGFSLPTIGRFDFSQRLEQETDAFASIYLELEVDAVVVNTSVIYPAAAAAIRAGVPLLLHSHGIVFPRLFPELDLTAWSKLDALQLNIADKVLVPSAWVSEQCRRTGHLSHSDVTVLPNGTELPQLYDDETEAAFSGVPEFVMLCTLEPNKGVSTFLEAAAKILAKRPGGAFFKVYGDGAPVYRESLSSFITHNNLSSSCSIHPKQEDVGSIYRSCHAAIVASEVESFSFIAIEAMSYAKPVIATRCGGPEDIVEDGKTGYLISVGDSDALADRMMQLMDDPRLSCRMGVAGRVRVKSHYDINKVARDYLDHILSMLKASRSDKDLKQRRLLMSLATLEMPYARLSESAMPVGNAAVNLDLKRSFEEKTIVVDSDRENVLLNALLRIKQCASNADFGSE